MKPDSDYYVKTYLHDTMDQCNLENSALEETLRQVSTLATLPHCLLVNIIESKLIVPCENGQLRVVSTCDSGTDECNAIDAFTSGKVHADAGFTSHADMPVSAILQFLKAARIHHLNIFYGENEKIVLNGRLLEKLLLLAGGRCASFKHDADSVELNEGTELVISNPDPVPGKPFIDHIINVFCKCSGVEKIYLFDIHYSSGESNLVVGCDFGDKAVCDSDPEFNHLIAQVVEDLPADSKDLVSLDFLALNDRDFKKLIETTIDPVFARKDG